MKYFIEAGGQRPWLGRELEKHFFLQNNIYKRRHFLSQFFYQENSICIATRLMPDMPGRIIAKLHDRGGAMEARNASSESRQHKRQIPL